MTRNDRLVSQLRSLVAKSKPFRSLVEREGRVEVTGASVEARALVLATLQDKLQRKLAVIVPGDAAIDDFESALRLFHRDPRCVAAYPSPSLSPYQDVAPSLGVMREEIRALGRLVEEGVDLLIVPVRALFARLPRADEFARRIVPLAEGDDLDMRALLERLIENGFVRTDLVGEPGELAFRGGILDLFPPNTTKPLRVELFGDTIDSLRWFDVETQRSEEASGAVNVLPMTHFPVTRETRQKLAKRLSLDFMDPLFKRDVAERIERLTENGTFPGIEHYLPAAIETASFLDLLEGWTVALVEPDEITTSVARFEGLLRNEYEAAAEKGRAAYAPTPTRCATRSSSPAARSRAASNSRTSTSPSTPNGTSSSRRRRRASAAGSAPAKPSSPTCAISRSATTSSTSTTVSAASSDCSA